MRNIVINYEDFEQAMNERLKEYGRYHELKMLGDIYFEFDGNEEYVTVELSANWTKSENVELIQLEIVGVKEVNDTLELKLRY